MIQSELKGKLPEIENREDVLTSCVFGLLRYLPLKRGLFRVLEKARDYSPINNNIFKNNPRLGKYDKVNYYFWERSERYGEPDLILIFESSNNKLPPLMLLIEVKYLSGKSRSGSEDQLKDYFLAVSHEKGRETFSNEDISKFKGEFIGLIYLTYFTQKEEVEKSVKELSKEWIGDCRKYIYGLRWNDITKSFKDVSKSEMSDCELKICEDIFLLLKRKNFIDFEGWLSPPSVGERPIFFEEFSFKDIPQNVLLTLNKFDKTIFYKGG